MIPLVEVPWKSTMLMLQNCTQGLVKEITVKWFLFMDWVSISFCVVVTRSMKGNPRLTLEEIRMEYAGESTAMSKRTGGSRKRPINSLLGWNKLGTGKGLYTLPSWTSSSSFFRAVWSMADRTSLEDTYISMVVRCGKIHTHSFPQVRNGARTCNCRMMESLYITRGRGVYCDKNFQCLYARLNSASSKLRKFIWKSTSTKSKFVTCFALG